MNVQAKRRMTAFAVVGALIAAVPLTGVAADALRGVSGCSDLRIDGACGIDARGVLGAGDPLSGMAVLDEALSAPGSEMPDSLLQEAVVLPGAHETRYTGDGVAGYVVDRPVSTVVESLHDEMEEKGWTAVPLGGVAGYTFVKQEGEWTWILATCDEVGSSTSVTLRCHRR